VYLIERMEWCHGIHTLEYAGDYRAG